MKAVVVSHWDVDGIASASIAVRRGAKRYRLSSITALPQILSQAVLDLERIGADALIIADLNPSHWQWKGVESALDYALALGVHVLWVDHHEWDEELTRELRSIGVELIVDTASVSARMLAERLGCMDGACIRLVEMAIDDDLFLGRDPLASRWRRILRWYGWSVRRKTVPEWARGRLWPEWAARLWESMRSVYEALLEKVASRVRVVRAGGVSIAVVEVMDDRLHPGEVHLAVLERGVEADVYAMIYAGGVSLRSQTLPLACIARRLGGGGHEKAAGIPGSEWTPESLAAAIAEALEACSTLDAKTVARVAPVPRSTRTRVV